MIAKIYILTNLTMIENLFNKSTSPKRSLFYSKLAILELCGWIEDSMDDIIRTCGNRFFKDSSGREKINNIIIKPTHGFQYNNHFRRMLMQLIGIIKLEKLERKLDPAKFEPMKATLEDLYISRNREAHTHLKGLAKTLDAPSVTKARFLVIYDGLRDIEDNLRQLKL